MKNKSGESDQANKKHDAIAANALTRILRTNRPNEKTSRNGPMHQKRVSVLAPRGLLYFRYTNDEPAAPRSASHACAKGSQFIRFPSRVTASPERTRSDGRTNSPLTRTRPALTASSASRRESSQGPRLFTPHLHGVPVHKTPRAHSLFTPPRLKRRLNSRLFLTFSTNEKRAFCLGQAL